MKIDSFKSLIFALKEYFHTYDPSNFSLFYAIKSCFGLFICMVLAFSFFNIQSIIFAILPCVFIFYMNNLKATPNKKFIILITFMFICSMFALIVPFLITLSFYIAIPTFFWIFIVIFLGAISRDLQLIGIYTTILMMAMLISASLNKFNPDEVYLATILGSSIAIAFRTFTFYTYGGFTRRTFLMLLNDLIYMCENLNNKKYDEWQGLLAVRISDLKELFSTKSANIKDTSLVKHQEMAMFYLLKCEEIALTLSSLRTLFRTHRDNIYINNIQEEIIYNLNELKKIFHDEKVNLKFFYLSRLKHLNTMPILCTSLEVLYYKFDIFRQGGAKTIKMQPEKNIITLDELKSRLSLDNKQFKFSIKVALATAFSMFLAVFYQIDHGIWIAMGVFTLFKESINTTAINNRRTFFAALLGSIIGIFIVFCISSKMLFIALFISYFACVYFKHFPYFIATVFIMINLTISFASVGLDYEKLIVVRMIDFVIAFIIVYIFSFIWPSKSEDDIKPTLRTTVKNLKEFLSAIVEKEDYHRRGNAVLLNITDLKNLLYESRTKKNKINHIRLLETLIEMNNLCISLNDYLYSKYNKIQPKEQSDIGILITRFKMMENIDDDLPYYFYDEVADKILSEDEKVKYFIDKISKLQDTVYRYLTE